MAQILLYAILLKESNILITEILKGYIMYRLFPRFLVKSRGWRGAEKSLSADPRKRQFTLLEVLVAFVITGTIIAGAMGILKASLWAASYYSHRTSASNIANSRIERLRTIPYADLASMTEDAAPVNSRGISDANGDFMRTTTLGSDYFNTRGGTAQARTAAITAPTLQPRSSPTMSAAI